MNSRDYAPVSDLSDRLRLTPAASETIDENVEYVRQQIMHELARRSRNSDHHIRTSDVESVVRALTQRSGAARLAYRWSWAVILILVFTAVTLQVIIQVNLRTTAWLITVAGAMVGVASGAASLEVAQEVMRRRRRASSRVQFEFLQAFNALENLGRRRAREILDREADDVDLGRVISALELMQLWTPYDARAFRQLLAKRNSIAHEDNSNLSPEQMADSFSELARLTAMLDSLSIGPGGKTSRAAVIFEKRVADALRAWGMRVDVAPPGVDYDLLAQTEDQVTHAEVVFRLIIKYRRAGILSARDVIDVMEKAPAGIPIVIVTNVAVSRYAADYLDLAEGTSESDKYVRVVEWVDTDDPAKLARAVIGISGLV